MSETTQTRRSITKENVKIIAAAPELLRSLQECTNAISKLLEMGLLSREVTKDLDLGNVLVNAGIAIQKATD